MYKEMIICIIVIILVLGLNFITQRCTKNAVDNMNERLLDLKDKLNNSDNVIETLENVMKMWHEKKSILEYFIEHDELEKVEIEMKELKAKIDEGNLKEGLINIERGMFILNHIKEKNMLKIQNIF